MARQGSAQATVAAPADVVFGVITDLERLPKWNQLMTGVVERPEDLAPGAEWVVGFRAMGRSWKSRSRVEELDASRRVFQYRSATDDGNPSFTVWRWEVEPDGAGSRVRLSWDLHPRTFWRRTLLVRIRGRQLRSEVSTSLTALERACQGDIVS
jgi:uncharacterized protein YndB with AHSA1/START domain